jgi:hypothetical protein
VVFETPSEDKKVKNSGVIERLSVDNSNKRIVITFKNTLFTKFYG